MDRGEEVEVISDLLYGQDFPTQQCLDLYQPVANEGKDQGLALIVYLHGGSWVARDKKEYKNIGVCFAKKLGVCVAVVNYRLSSLSSPEIKHPIHTLDCVQALDWLVAHSESYPYSKKRIFVMGHSAGAFMGVLLGLAPSQYFSSSSEFRKGLTLAGIIGVQGLYDMGKYYIWCKDHYPEYYREFDLAFGEYDQARWTALSPQGINAENLDEKDDQKKVAQPPYLIIHSPQDSLVPVEESKAILEHLKSDNVRASDVTGLYSQENGLYGDHFDVVVNIGTEKDCLTVIVGDWIKPK